jgi:exonuclease III
MEIVTRKNAANRTKCDHEIRISSYNILDGRSSRLEQSLRCMKTMGIDIGFLLETKLIKGFHATNCEGYEIFATESNNQHQGGAALFYRKSDNFHTEGTKSFGPNVIMTLLISGKKRWRLIGAYVPPSETDGSTLEYIQQAASFGSTKTPLILMGDFNVNTRRCRGLNNRQIATLALFASLGVSDIDKNFIQRKKRGYWTWSKEREGHTIYSRCDAICTTNSSDFSSFRIKEPRFDSDHRMLLGILKPGSRQAQQRYVKKRSTFPIRISEDSKTATDFLMDELANLVEAKHDTNEPYRSWISQSTWILISKKSEARRSGNATTAKILSKQIRKNLRADRLQRIEQVARLIEQDLAKNEPKKAYGRIKGWYRDKPNQIPKPTFQDEEKTRLEYETLYTAFDPPGEPIPIHITAAYDVNDSLPPEEEVVKAVLSLKLDKAAGATGLTAEHLRKWMKGALQEDPIPAMVAAWKMIRELVDLIFKGEPIPKSFGFGVLVLIPKGVPDQYRGIALLEIVYKLVSSIINRRLVNAIPFHDAIHGFRAARGTGTAIIRAKLLMQLAQRQTKPIYMLFLDLKKAYDTLDRNRTLEILKGYGVGPKIRGILEQVWDADTMVPKQAGFYGKAFRACRGVRQGDIVSPTIFNIVADAVIRAAEAQSNQRHGKMEQSDTIFYADDGLLVGDSWEGVQGKMDAYTEMFARVGLQMNASKTKAMIMTGGRFIGKQSAQAMDYRHGKTGSISHRERSLQQVICPLCGASVTRQYLVTHQSRKTCKDRQREKGANMIQASTTFDSNQTMSEPRETLPRVYQVTMKKSGKTKCPSQCCPAYLQSSLSMRQHFRTQHHCDTIIVDGTNMPQCTKCGIFAHNALSEQHQKSQDCIKWTTIREQRQSNVSEQEISRNTVFTTGGETIENVTEFKYLGRILRNNDSDNAAVESNIQKARMKWGRLCRLLTREGTYPKAMATFYKAIVQSVLLYGSESWVLTKEMVRKLQSFHHRCARYLAREHIQQDNQGNWTAPPSTSVLEKTGLQTVQEYIQRRKATILEYAKTTEILQKCEASSPLASAPNQLVWWETS